MTVIIRSATERDGSRKWSNLSELTLAEISDVETFEEGTRMLNVIACQAHLEDLESAYPNEDATEIDLPKEQESKACVFVPLRHQRLWSFEEVPA